MERDEDQSIDIETGDWGISSAGELGALLKSHRQKLGLTLDQLSEQTRVRARFLEALENEDYDRLPAPGFVKGFIRSYARAVGLEPESVLSLYEAANFSQAKAFEKHKAMVSGKSRKPLAVLIILLIIALAGVGFHYAWQLYGFKAPDSPPTQPEAKDSEKPVPSKEFEDVIVEEQGVEKGSTDVKPGTSAALLQEPVPAPEAPPPADEGQEVTPSPEGPEKEDSERIPEPPAPVMENGRSRDRTAEAPTAPEPMDGPRHTLKALVKERTWIRVFVDDQEPKEYVFQPGSQPQWEAVQGFELLIGNAGGIDLEFDGKEMRNLGESGKVVRMFLPEGFKQNKKED